MNEIAQKLRERIDAAIKRIKSGSAPMRIPADQTDPDLVLADAKIALDAQAAEIARLREALTAIEQWEVPLVESRGEVVSMSVAYGSNGVRDYFRGVARAALSGESK